MLFCFTDSVLNEVIRLTSGVFMVRAITKDTSFEMEDGTKHNLRAGDRVAMYPPALHKDPEIFENPLVGFCCISPLNLFSLYLIYELETFIFTKHYLSV